MFAPRSFEGCYKEAELFELGSSSPKVYKVATSKELWTIEFGNGGLECVPVRKLRYVDAGLVHGQRPRLEIVTDLSYMRGFGPAADSEIGKVVIFVNNFDTLQLHSLIKRGNFEVERDHTGASVYTSEERLYAYLRVVKNRSRNSLYPYSISCYDNNSIVLLSSQASLDRYGSQQVSSSVSSPDSHARDPQTAAETWLRREYL